MATKVKGSIQDDGIYNMVCVMCGTRANRDHRLSPSHAKRCSSEFNNNFNPWMKHDFEFPREGFLGACENESLMVQNGLHNVDVGIGIAVPANEKVGEQGLQKQKPTLMDALMLTAEDARPWVASRDACSAALGIVCENLIYRYTRPEEELIRVSGDPEEGYYQAWPSTVERRLLTHAYDGLPSLWEQVHRMAYDRNVLAGKWYELVVELVYRCVSIVASMYDEMEAAVSVDVLHMFHILFMCAADVSRCTEYGRAVRGPLDKLRQLLVPGVHQLHTYQELMSHEDRFVILKACDFLVEREPLLR